MKNDRLVQIRGKLSQADFAKEVGLHKNTVARYEAGEREPDGDYLRRLMARGYSANWVLTGEGPMRLDEAASAAPGAASQPARLDLDTLEAATRVVRGALERTRTTTTDAGFAELVRAIYEMLEQGAALDAAQRIVAGLLGAVSKQVTAETKRE